MRGQEREGLLLNEQVARNASRASCLLRAMGNESRLIILCRLIRGEKTVGELVEEVGLSQSALSQHLAVLRDNGLVRTRRCARLVYYSLDSEESAAVIETLYTLYGEGG
ncbi:MAG: metalloregulator ArsR/SmtB family transcription factor [Rhodospirillales bacterium]|nr:metalloregulator ArsR/SmtB family transcription factor [Rhodospirillales bacterium]MCW8861096.1 metalloregulator ArsR/SmtB family transcription factor [Rhodospirillales bacterium]MCW8952223.1 metalloregulator ArsR/SmtB family transcription factor [Rhodospirillales bacterium]MCW8970566.1 metalloregulator ArsR/SmtB family transcription factor [Rhodospirillales bacterium]MCW9002822.1 metalloregulator ArsR/SmtB family transcription factor [Rhodospirillales bacterium]